MIAESEIGHSRQENPAQISKARAQFGLNGGSFKCLAWPWYADFANTSSPNCLRDAHSVGVTLQPWVESHEAHYLWSNCLWKSHFCAKQTACCVPRGKHLHGMAVNVHGFISQPLALAPFLMALRLSRALNEGPCGVKPTQDLNSGHSAVPKMLQKSPETLFCTSVPCCCQQRLKSAFRGTGFYFIKQKHFLEKKVLIFISVPKDQMYHDLPGKKTQLSYTAL